MSAIEHHLRQRGLEVEQLHVDPTKTYGVTAVDETNHHCAFPRMSEPIDLVARADAGILAAFANPCGVDIIILEVFVDVTVKSTGAADLNAGVAADAVTSSDTLLDGVDIGTAAIQATVGVNAGTNGRQSRVMADDEFVTFSGSAATTGMVATARILYVPIAA